MEIDQAKSLGTSTNDLAIKAGIPQLEKDRSGYMAMAKDQREKIKVRSTLIYNMNFMVRF